MVCVGLLVTFVCYVLLLVVVVIISSIISSSISSIISCGCYCLLGLFVCL